MIIGLELNLLKKNYSFLETRIVGNRLKCVGHFTPSEFSRKFVYEVQFSTCQSPKVFTIEPKIKYHEDIHMYPQDNSLCLYYPKDFSWTKTSHLYNTIIPWTHEWFVFYELYQIYGVWLHPAVAHGNNKI